MGRIAGLALTGALLALAMQDAIAQQPAQQALAPAVTVSRAAEREVVERAIVTGTLIPRQEILVSPEIEGLRITEVLVEEGASVAQGEVLARLSRDLLETSLAQNSAPAPKLRSRRLTARSFKPKPPRSRPGKHSIGRDR
jgi:multidrug efflux pump subunit AcrA (membrane-fusion protein)